MANQLKIKKRKSNSKDEIEKPLKRLKRSLTIENLWIYILSVLKERDMHAYSIFKEMSKRYEIKPGLVTPYVVLYKLEEDDYIRGYDSGRRRYYKITEKGRDLLRKAKEEIKYIIKKL
ncbi:MAG: helix-turn-helix transcriptional regulator [Candidatus Micrarchaeia archaeon]